MTGDRMDQLSDNEIREYGKMISILANSMISKQMGQFSPCRIYCLSPMEALIIGVAPEAEFSTLSTLWDSDKCKLCVIL